MSTVRAKYMETTIEMARRAFERHEITKESEGRWYLQRRHPDGKPESTYAAEIIALENGALYVGGDIKQCVFAYGPRDALARVYWMGECTDLGYYVGQKARIGSGWRCSKWIAEIAREELAEHIADLEPEHAAQLDRDHLRAARQADDESTFYSAVTELFDGDFEVASGMGCVLDASVIYAHAALARLSQLLRARESISTAHAFDANGSEVAA